MSKRVTPAKRSKSKRSKRSFRYELVSRRAGIERDDLPRVLANAVDDDPFEIIGLVSIATATLQHDVGELFDEFAEQDPRLGPVLWATVANLPFIDHFARPERIVDEVLPDWLMHLEQARVTGIMRRVVSQQRDASSYLVEVTMLPDLVATCVFDLEHERSDDIMGFCTVAAPMSEVAEHYQTKYRHTCDRAYEAAPFPEGVQNLLIALDESLQDRPRRFPARPPWPANLPVAAFVVNQAVGQLGDAALLYTALRRTTSSQSQRARAHRRSLTTWPRTDHAT